MTPTTTTPAPAPAPVRKSTGCLWMVRLGSLAAIAAVATMCYCYADLPGDAAAREATGLLAAKWAVGGFALAAIGRLFG